MIWVAELRNVSKLKLISRVISSASQILFSLRKLLLSVPKFISSEWYEKKRIRCEVRMSRLSVDSKLKALVAIAISRWQISWVQIPLEYNLIFPEQRTILISVMEGHSPRWVSLQKQLERETDTNKLE